MLNWVQSRLSMFVRMMIVCAITAAAGLAPLYMLLNDRFREIGYAKDERVGIAYLGALWPVYHAALTGAEPTADQAADFESAAAKFDAKLNVAEKSAEFRQTTSTEDKVQFGADLIVQAAAGAGLILDSELKTFYLMQMVRDDLPGLARVARQLSNYVGEADGAALSADQKLALTSAYAEYTETNFDLSEAVNNVAFADEATGLALKEAVTALEDAGFTFDDAAFTAVDDALNAGAVSNAGDLVAARDEILAKIDSLWMTSYTEMEKALLQREQGAGAAVAAGLGAAGLALALAILFAVIIARGGSRRIADLVGAMQALIAGKLATEVPHTKDTNETGQIAQSVLVFKRSLLDQRRLEEEAAKAKAEADAQRRADLFALADHFEKTVMETVTAVSSAATQLEATSSALADTAKTVARESDVMAKSADIASTNVQVVASAAEEMSASSGAIAHQVEQASHVARMAVQRSSAASKTVSALSESASRIGEVVQLISAIASKTNLLALNATIEAARAGEAGRGFAVVAGEVKSLANQTAQAIDEIGRQITGVQQATTGTVAAIGSISETIAQIDEIAGAIARTIGEQSAAVSEISQSMATMANQTREVSETVDTVRSGARETDGGASDSLNAARELGRNADRLRGAVGEFLAHVRAA